MFKRIPIFETVMFISLILICGCQNEELLKKTDQQTREIEALRKKIESKDQQDEDRRIAQIIKQREPVCQFLYEVHRQCYAGGIQKGNLGECVRMGAAIWEMAQKNFSEPAIGELLGKTCTIACKQGIDGKGLPSYSDFIKELKWCIGR